MQCSYFLIKTSSSSGVGNCGCRRLGAFRKDQLNCSSSTELKMAFILLGNEWKAVWTGEKNGECKKGRREVKAERSAALWIHTGPEEARRA